MPKPSDDHLDLDTPLGALRGGAPRYVMVAEALIREIQEGKYPVGALLPAEREIGARFGVSRHTTREAIRRLEDLGLINRRAGIGTTVKSRLAQSRYSATISDLTELVHYAEKTRLQVLGEEWITVADSLANALPGAVGQRWLKITALRFPQDSDTPISHTQTLVPAAFESIRQGIKGPHATVFKLIEELRGERVAEVRQDITSLPLPRHVAAALGVAPATPSLYVERSYFDKRGEHLSLSLNFYPQDRFKISTRWRLDASADE